MIFFVFFIACQKNKSEFDPNFNNQFQKIKIAYTNQPDNVLIHIAMKMGFFKEFGLIVEPVMFTYGKEALQAVIDNKADIGTVAETPLMFNIMRGKDIVINATMVTSTKNLAIIARVDSGIKDPRDLKRKKIGFIPSTTSAFFLDSFLLANGLTIKDVIAVPVNPIDAQRAIESKKVDALVIWNYYLTQIKDSMGENARIFYDEQIYTATFNIASMRSFTKNNSNVIMKVLHALIKAEEYIKKNPNEAKRIFAQSSQVSPGLVEKVWNDYKFHVSLSQTIKILLEDQARWAIKNKLTPNLAVPDFSLSIITDSLTQINPELVKINR